MLRHPLPAGSFRVSSPFGPRRHPVTGEIGKHHNGLDLAAPTGTPVYAAGPGVVSYTMANHAINGNAVGISHSSGSIGRTTYLHLSRVDVRKGQAVEAGQQIGLVGSTGRSTGPHLHFIARNRSGTAIDPAPLLSAPGAARGLDLPLWAVAVGLLSSAIFLGVIVGSR